MLRGGSKLVIGYGNDLRRDDGAGRRVADEIASLRLPGVAVVSAHQLTPELAEALSDATVAVFVDARLPDGEDDVDVRVERIASGASPPPNAIGHFGDPRQLLPLTRTLYGRAPEAWWVTIPAKDLGFGEFLSESASRGVETAVRETRRLLGV